jgi:hypothetical protein
LKGDFCHAANKLSVGFFISKNDIATDLHGAWSYDHAQIVSRNDEYE